MPFQSDFGLWRAIRPCPFVLQPGAMSKSPLVVSLSFILLGLFWGGSFIAMKEVTQEVPAALGAFLRVLVASFVLALILRVQGRKLFLVKARDRIRVWTAGALGLALPFTLLFWAEKFITPGLAGLLNASVPIWLALLILIFRPVHEKREINWSVLVGVLIGFFGVFILFSPALAASEWLVAVGALAGAAASLCYAIANLVTRSVFRRPHIEFGQNLFEQHLGALVFLGVFNLGSGAFEVNLGELSLSAWMSTLYLGAFSTALAMTLYFNLLQAVGSVRASVVTYLIPIFALGLDYLFYGNFPLSQELWGAVIIFVSITFLRQKKPPLHVVPPTQQKFSKPEKKAA